MQFVYSTEEALKVYDAKLKIRKNGTIVLKEYKKAITKIDKGFEEITKDCSIVSLGRVSSTHNIKEGTEELKKIRSDSLKRSRDLVIDYASQNEDKFNSFITLTLKDNITDVTQANKLLNNWLNQIRRECKKLHIEFYYLGIPEFQKRGAVHYHLLTSLIPASSLLPFQTNKTNMYDVKYWNYGYSSAFDFKKDTDENFNIALYMIKYLFKDINDGRLYGHTRVLKSNNLEKPNEYELLHDSDTYKYALDYIEKRYDNVGTHYVLAHNENPYIIPSKITSYSSKQDYSNILDNIIKDK